MADLQRRFPATKVDNWTSGAFGTPATAPGAPSEVVGTAGNTQVALTWTAGAENNGTISGYKVEKNSGSWSDVTADTGSASTSYTVTGLTNGTAYTFRVSAINEVGTGSASSASSSVTPYTVPGAPTSMAAAAVAGTGNASLTWVAPGTPGGSAITGYSIKRGSDVLVDETGDTTASYKDASSSPATPYTYYVAGVNAAGIGTYSSGGAVTTGSALYPATAKATGGVYTESGGYGRHKFEYGGIFTWTDPSPGTIQYMLIGGGGGGGFNTAGGGGGGAGGVYISPTSVPASTGMGPGTDGAIFITVGAGGKGGGGGGDIDSGIEGSGRAAPGSYSTIDFGPTPVHPHGLTVVGGGGCGGTAAGPSTVGWGAGAPFIPGPTPRDPRFPGPYFSGSGGGGQENYYGGNASPGTPFDPGGSFVHQNNPTGYSGFGPTTFNYGPGSNPTGSGWSNPVGGGGGGAGGGGGNPVVPGIPYSPWTAMPGAASAGGVGIASSISGSSVNYGGGGQGGYQSKPGQGANPAAPYGGGSAGIYGGSSSTSTGQPGTAGTGGGGGASGHGPGPSHPAPNPGGSYYQPSGRGGPGICWIVYPV